MTGPGSAGRAVLVTGGAGGIGSQTVRELVGEGASVVVADIDTERGRSLTDELAAGGAQVRFVRCDVTDPEQVQAAVAVTVDTFGALDGAVNAAGTAGTSARITEQDDANWATVLGVNLTGVFAALRSELSVMVPQGRGSVVNVASISGLVGGRNLSPYIAAKHGVVGLTKAVAMDVADLGIRVNAVCPAFTDTPMIASVGVVPGTPAWDSAIERIPLHRVGRPVEIARSITWLLSDHAGFVTGACLPVDGGYTAQ